MISPLYINFVHLLQIMLKQQLSSHVSESINSARVMSHLYSPIENISIKLRYKALFLQLV
jgi:dihydroorotase